MTFIEKHTSKIKALCATHKVRRLYVFGSVLTADFDEESDIDFIVEFEPLNAKQYAENYFNLKFALEAVLQRPVDLLEEHTIRNPYFKTAIESQQQLIYAN